MSLVRKKHKELASPRRFSRQIEVLNVQSTWEILGFGVILSKALELFMELISVFRNCDAANILIDYPIVTEFRIYSQYLLAAVCLI